MTREREREALPVTFVTESTRRLNGRSAMELTIDEHPIGRQFWTIRLLTAVLVDEHSNLLEISNRHFESAEQFGRLSQPFLVVVILLVVGQHNLHQT